MEMIKDAAGVIHFKWKDGFFPVCEVRSEAYSPVKYNHVSCASCKRIGKEQADLYRRAQRVIKKAEKKGYTFNNIELNIFEALGRGDWVPDKINWLSLEMFDRMYCDFYPQILHKR